MIRKLALAAAAMLMATTAQAADLKVGFVYVGPVGDFGWSYQHDQGRQAIEKEFGDRVETTYVESVPEGPDAERVIRHWTRPLLAVRQRPGTSEPGAVLRGGDVPGHGPSFPSGHVILAVAIACIVAVEIPEAGVWLPFLLAFLVMFGRVYVGAHNPLDVTAGLGLGLIVGSCSPEPLAAT